MTMVSSYWLMKACSIDNLKYDWLMIMLLDDADHETVKLSVRVLDFGALVSRVRCCA